MTQKKTAVEEDKCFPQKHSRLFLPIQSISLVNITAISTTSGSVLLMPEECLPCVGWVGGKIELGIIILNFGRR